MRWLLVAIALFAILVTVATSQLRIARQLRAEEVRIRYQCNYDNWDDLERYTLNAKAKPPMLVRFFGPDIGSTIVDISATACRNPARVAELSSQLSELRLLSIQECDLADSDLVPLLKLKKLRGLYLRDTKITDASIGVLKQMEQLKVLNLHNTELSSHAVANLQAALPNTKIHHGPGGRGFF